MRISIETSGAEVSSNNAHHVFSTPSTQDECQSKCPTNPRTPRICTRHTNLITLYRNVLPQHLLSLPRHQVRPLALRVALSPPPRPNPTTIAAWTLTIKKQGHVVTKQASITPIATDNDGLPNDRSLPGPFTINVASKMKMFRIGFCKRIASSSTEYLPRRTYDFHRPFMLVMNSKISMV